MTLQDKLNRISELQATIAECNAELEKILGEKSQSADKPKRRRSVNRYPKPVDKMVYDALMAYGVAMTTKEIRKAIKVLYEVSLADHAIQGGIYTLTKKNLVIKPSYGRYLLTEKASPEQMSLTTNQP